jgi:hypothetical protein
METKTILPDVIKLMIILVFIDVIATMTFFYLDTMYDPDSEFSDIENLISFIFPLFYFAGMVWLIRTHIPITKIIFYIVFALELATFIVDFESAGFDIFSILSFISIIAILGCIYIVNADVGKRWFVMK